MKAQVTSSFAELWVAFFPDYMYNQGNLIMEESEMKRCQWADPSSELYIAYHDNEWGQPEHDDRKLFERLTLESFQAGLSWLTILKKREAFRMAFDGFQPDVVALYGPEKVEELMADAGIVRNRRKIEAAIRNAGVYLSIQKAVSYTHLDVYKRQVPASRAPADWRSRSRPHSCASASLLGGA